MRDFWAQEGSEECQYLQKEYRNYISQKNDNKIAMLHVFSVLYAMFKW